MEKRETNTGFNQHCILQTTILALKWPMRADVPLNHIKIKSNQASDYLVDYLNPNRYHKDSLSCESMV